MRQNWFRRLMCLAMVCLLAVSATAAGLGEALEGYSENDIAVEASVAGDSSAEAGEAAEAAAPEAGGDAGQDASEADEGPVTEPIEDAVEEASLELGDFLLDGEGGAQAVEAGEELLYGGDEAAAKALPNGEDIPIDGIHFPDATFRAIISGPEYDVDGDGALCDAEINAITTLDVTGYMIYSLRGVEYFTALNTLKCANNKLTNLNLSENAALSSLDVSQNELKALDISQNVALTRLDCSNNDLTGLDLSHSLQLCALNVSGNDIETLDITNCPRLREIVRRVYYSATQSTYGYYAGADSMLVLDIGALIYPLPVDEENFPDAGFRAWVLEVVDGDHDGLLTREEAEKVTEANFANYSPIITSLVGIEHFPALVKLDCSGNALTELSLSANAALRELNCASNALTTLSVEHCASLEVLDCSHNNLTTLDVSALSRLKRLDCRSNLLLVLTLPQSKKLMYLDCGQNQLTSLNISGCSNLTTLCCESNGITRLNLSDATVLMRIYNTVYRTTSTQYEEYSDGDAMLRFDLNVKMTALVINMDTFPDASFRAWVETNCDTDHSGTLSESETSAVTDINVESLGIRSLKGMEYFTALETLACSNNYLTGLDLSGNTMLVELICEGCRLTVLNLRMNTLLTYVNCSDNQLTSLDISHLNFLNTLYCDDNQLVSLNLAGLNSLNYLNCAGNQLDTLDISGAPNLTTLRCEHNSIDALSLYLCEFLFGLYTPDYLIQASPYYVFALPGTDTERPTLSFDTDVHIVTVPEFYLAYDTSLDCSVGSPFRIVVRDGLIVEKFHSENRKVASVDETGLVIPEGEGKTKIHVRILNGDTIYLKVKVDDPTMPTGIELDHTGTVTLDVDESLVLDYTLLPYPTAESDVKWHSDNTRVAKVDDLGVVTARKEGTANITATTKRGNKKAKVKIKVVDSTEPTDIILSESGTVDCVLQDETLQIDWELLPEGAVSEIKWSSSSSKVAKVDDNGLVTFRHEGTTTITATTKKGNRKAKVKLKVVDGAEPESVTIEQGTYVSLYAGDTIELNAEVETKGGYDYTGSLKWSSSKKKVASVDSSGFVVARKPGTAKITVQTKNKKKASIYIYVN